MVRHRTFQRDHSLFFYIFNAWILAKSNGRSFRHLDREPIEVVIDMLNNSAIITDKIIRHGGDLLTRIFVFQVDDIVIGY